MKKNKFQVKLKTYKGRVAFHSKDNTGDDRSASIHDIHHLQPTPSASSASETDLWEFAKQVQKNEAYSSKQKENLQSNGNKTTIKTQNYDVQTL